MRRCKSVTIKCPAQTCDLHSFPTRRSSDLAGRYALAAVDPQFESLFAPDVYEPDWKTAEFFHKQLQDRSEEHTSELQSRGHLVCRILLEKKNTGCSSR